MIKRYEIFTTPTCFKCKQIKKHLEESRINLEALEVDASTPEGLNRAREKGVSSVPVLFFYDEKDQEIGSARDLDEVEKILEQNK